jgi:thiosulfate dehydrogenase [quinone] large subunit
MLRQLGAAGFVGAFGLFLAGITAALGREGSSDTSATASTLPPSGGGSKGGSSNSATTAPSTTKVSTPSGTRIGLASAVGVGGAARFSDPANQQPAYVVQPEAGHFVAFSAICTHAGCTVGFQRGSPPEFVCPCHGSIYNATTGQVIQGPAVLPLPGIKIEESTSGELYAEG